MQNPLRQLRKVMLQLVVVVLVAVGIALIVAGFWLDPTATPAERWSAALIAFGFTFFTAGGVTMIWESYLRTVNERLTTEALDESLRRAAPAIRDVVLDSLAFNASTLKGVTSDEQLDHIAMNALALRLDDQELAHELYTDVRDQVINASERWRDVKVAITLSPWTKGPSTGRGSMFVATIRLEYKTVPATSTMRFACVSDEPEYRELLRDESVTSAWHLAPEEDGLDAASPESYELLQFSLNGKAKTIRRTTRRGAQLYTVGLGAAGSTKEVALTYTYRVLVQRRGNMLYVDLPRPAWNVRVQLDYSQAGVKYVNTLDYFASSRRSHVERAPEGSEAKTINVSFDGWVLPRAGVAFVWVLNDEQARLPVNSRRR